MNHIIIDKSGAPAIKFSETKYIHLLPVTKYQFERFIWQASPSCCDYEKIIEDTGRISPDEINKKNLSSAFLTNINFEEALEFSTWLGARLPTDKEWEEAYNNVFKNSDLFKEIIEYFQSADKQQLDLRILKLIKSLINIKIMRNDLGNYLGELVSEFPISPYGRIYLKSNETTAQVLGRPSRKMKDSDFGCCCVIEEEVVFHKFNSKRIYSREFRG